MKRQVVFASGCFDILHIGHVKFLEFCKKVYENFGYRLHISVDSDNKVRRDKGINRPIFSELEREEHIRLLLNLGERLYIGTHESNEQLEQKISTFRPILVVGRRWKGAVVGEEYASNIIYFDEIWPCPSTTDIIKRILEIHK